MAQHHSHSYDALEQVTDAFAPDERITSHMVLTGDGAAIEIELDELEQIATTFDVLVSTAFDETDGDALVLLNGTAASTRNLAAHMGQRASAS